MIVALFRLYLALVLVAAAGDMAGIRPAVVVPANAAAMVEEADALVERARDRLFLGAYDRAIEDLLAARALAERQGDDGRLASVLGTLGDTYLAAGRRPEAEQALEEGLDLARGAGFFGLEAAIRNSLGNLALARNDAPGALDRYRQAAALAERGNRPDVAASAAINAARVLIGDDRSEGPAAWLGRAEDALDRQPAGSAKAMQLLGLARQWMAIDAAARAMDALRAAEDMAREQADPRLESYAIGYRARLYEDRGRLREALELTRRALFSAQLVGAPEVTYLWQWQIGRLLAADGRIDDAISSYRQAARTLKDLRPDLIAVAQQGGGSTLRATVEPVYLELADLLLKRAAAQPGRAARQTDLRAARDLIEQFRAAELEDYFRDECVAELQASVQQIDQLAGRYPRATRTAVLYPILLPERTVLLLSLADGLVQRSVPVTAAKLTTEVRALRRFLEKRTTREYLPHARALYNRLIRPIEPDLERAGIDTLVFVPDGPLRTIPLAALHDGEGFVIDRFAVATVPGLGLLDPRPVAETRMIPLLNGLTEPVQGFPALPFVAAELQTIADLYGGKVLMNETFVVPEFGQSLAQRPYSVVHIASHGRFAGDAEDSFLLTYDGRLDMDGLEELVKLSRFRDEPIELLTLSACQTAAGDDRAALGLAGVAIKAGARSALATLWFINDRASSLLTAEFYRRLSATPRPTKAEALRAAQRAVREDLRYRHPAYWSPFLIIGNWL